ncbi:MAG TPA: trehalose-phosphatase [Candidatus Paceibacterota bacterium]
MQNALRKLPTIASRLRSHGCVLLLDFDGTLVDLETDYRTPRLSPKSQRLLRRLSRTYPLAIISGRSLADIARRVGLQSAGYAGCHGLEWRAGGTRRAVKIPAHTAAAFDNAKKQLRRLAGEYGARTENKKLSFALHYRTLARAKGRTLAVKARKIVDEVNRRNAYILAIDDQYTFDIRPNVSASKGTSARLLYHALKKSTRAIPIYIGDSLTDEDAFRTFSRGITIRVGKNRRSAAQYFVPTRSGVDAFLSQLP